MISADRIPNNVDLGGNKRLQRALEHWQPKYLQWWRDMGPQGFQDYHQVYVRTATSVDPEGWVERGALHVGVAGRREVVDADALAHMRELRSALDREAAVDRQRLAGDVAGGGAGEEQHGGRDVVGRAEAAHRRAGEQRRA